MRCRPIRRVDRLTGRGAALVAALLLAGCSAWSPPTGAGDVRRITLVGVSDWHGQLDPMSVAVGGVGRRVGGAAVLKAYFDRARRANPGGTLVVTAGDAFGATPPESSFFEDVPAVEVQNALGFDVDTLGNHNFDRGLDHLGMLMGRARFAYLAANVVAPDGRRLAPPTRVFVLDGVRVGVIGVGNPETPVLVVPDRYGDYQFLEPAPVVNEHAAALRRAGAEVVVVLAHVGASRVAADGMPIGPLGNLAGTIRGVDVLVGDHTDVSVNARVGDLLVVECRSRGVEYAVVELHYERAARRIVRKAATLRPALADEVTPDPAVAALVERWRARAQPLYDGVVGRTPVVLAGSRSGESALGNFVADALRATYGADLAFVNSGGLRDALPSAYQPADRGLRRPSPGYAAGPPWDVVRGDLQKVFPFGNVAVTFRLSGRTLWAALENSVAAGVLRDDRFSNVHGGFLQVSGFRYRFDARRPAGRRVTAVALAGGTPVAADDREYGAVTVDFLYGGGDGYTMLDNGTGTTREPLADVVAGAIAATAVPSGVEGRVMNARD